LPRLMLGGTNLSLFPHGENDSPDGSGLDASKDTIARFTYGEWGFF